jgi:hypothetical protein
MLCRKSASLKSESSRRLCSDFVSNWRPFEAPYSRCEGITQEKSEMESQMIILISKSTSHGKKRNFELQELKLKFNFDKIQIHNFDGNSCNLS